MAGRASQPVQYAFNAGELSPLLEGRFDQARYGYGLRRMRNYLPTLQGPARKRPGFKLCGEVHNSAQRSWLIPFVFSQTDSYQIEFGDSFVRFITDRAYVTEAAKSISAITLASPGVFTSNAHGYSNGDDVFLANIGGMPQLSGRTLTIANATTNTFTLVDEFGSAVSTASLAAYTSGGTVARIYTLASPFPASALTGSDQTCRISYAQSGDVMYLCVPGYQTRKLTRSAPASWAFSVLDQTGGPFKSVDPDQTITVYASAATGSVSLIASSAIFQAAHVGALFLLERKLTDTVTAWEPAKTVSVGNVRRSQGNYYEALSGTTTGTITPSHTEGARFDGDAGVNWQYLHSGYGWAKITAFVSATEVTATVISRIPSAAVGSGNASTRWAFGEWNVVDGYPTHVAFFRERLFFGRGTQLFGSVPADFENFSGRDAGVVSDDSAISIDIRSGVNDAIKFMIPSADLLVGTEGGEFSVSEISSADPLGPTNIAALAGPGYGARGVLPAKVNDSIVYVQPGGRNLRELRYAFETDGYASLDRTAFAEHIARGRINHLTFQKEPDSIVWQTTQTGELLAWSYQREQDLSAWSKHPVGGSGFVECVSAIPAPDGSYSEVYAIIRRTIQGQTKRYVEYLAEHWEPETDALEDQYYLDSGLTYSGVATTTVRNLNHLEGQTVGVLADGNFFTAVVSGGAVTLSVAASKVQVGLLYPATLRSMNLVRPGALARITSMLMSFYGAVSGALKAIWRSGTDSRTQTEAPRPVQFRDGAIPLASAITPYQGIKLIEGGNFGDAGREACWEFTDESPFACTVRGAAPMLVDMKG